MRGLLLLNDTQNLEKLRKKISKMYKKPVRLVRVSGDNKLKLLMKYKLMDRVKSLPPTNEAMIVKFSKNLL